MNAQFALAEDAEEKLIWEGKPEASQYASNFRIFWRKPIRRFLSLAIFGSFTFLYFHLHIATSTTTKVVFSFFLVSSIFFAFQAISHLWDNFRIENEAKYIHYYLSNKRVLIEYLNGKVQIVRASPLSPDKLRVHLGSTIGPVGNVTFDRIDEETQKFDLDILTLKKTISQRKYYNELKYQLWCPPHHFLSVKNPELVYLKIQEAQKKCK